MDLTGTNFIKPLKQSDSETLNLCTGIAFCQNLNIQSKNVMKQHFLTLHFPFFYLLST